MAQTRNILLATDLAARGDRPLDRAVALARDWGARLVLLHAASPEIDPDPGSRPWGAPWRQLADREAAARRRIAIDLGPDAAALDPEIVIRFGRPGTELCAWLADHPCDLVITGVARDETLGRRLLGDTVDHLIHHAQTPLLIVRRRVHGRYPRLLVTSDFSEPARDVAARAAALFPDVPRTLVHGYAVPFAGVLMDDRDRTAFAGQGEAAAQAFATALPDAAGGFADRLIAPGDPAALVRAALDKTPDALTVAGSHGSGGLFDRLLGSTARRLIDETDGDLLLIPAARRS